MITVQVIDTVSGRPAALIPVVLDYFETGFGWAEVSHAATDAEGVVENFKEPSGEGIYRLTFDVAAYYADPFFPTIGVTVDVRDPAQDCHLAVMLSPFAYSVSRA